MLALWQPQAGLPLAAAAATALALGILHGVTPDEHTWPITFSYAIGSYSSRRGLWVGLLFSAAFTVQRAIGSELAYLALARWMRDPGVDYAVYLAVGVAMAVAGWYVLGGRPPWRLDPRPRDPHRPGRGISPGMALVHGFIAGWGFGAYAVILYSVLAPAMPSVWLGWLPGLCFGVGTTLVQAAAGATFGWWSRRLRMPEAVAERVAVRVAGRTLAYGGAAFVGAGLLGLAAPKLAAVAVRTPIPIHNLHSLGIGFVLVIVVVLGIGLSSMVIETRNGARAAAAERSASPARG